MSETVLDPSWVSLISVRHRFVTSVDPVSHVGDIQCTNIFQSVCKRDQIESDSGSLRDWSRCSTFMLSKSSRGLCEMQQASRPLQLSMTRWDERVPVLGCSEEERQGSRNLIRKWSIHFTVPSMKPNEIQLQTRLARKPTEMSQYAKMLTQP